MELVVGVQGGFCRMVRSGFAGRGCRVLLGEARLEPGEEGAPGSPERPWDMVPAAKDCDRVWLDFSAFPAVDKLEGVVSAVVEAAGLAGADIVVGVPAGVEASLARAWADIVRVMAHSAAQRNLSVRAVALPILIGPGFEDVFWQASLAKTLTRAPWFGPEGAGATLAIGAIPEGGAALARAVAGEGPWDIPVWRVTKGAWEAALGRPVVGFPLWERRFREWFQPELRVLHRPVVWEGGVLEAQAELSSMVAAIRGEV